MEVTTATATMEPSTPLTASNSAKDKVVMEAIPEATSNSSTNPSNPSITISEQQQQQPAALDPRPQQRAAKEEQGKTNDTTPPMPTNKNEASPDRGQDTPTKSPIDTKQADAAAKAENVTGNPKQSEHQSPEVIVKPPLNFPSLPTPASLIPDTPPPVRRVTKRPKNDTEKTSSPTSAVPITPPDIASLAIPKVQKLDSPVPRQTISPSAQKQKANGNDTGTSQNASDTLPRFPRNLPKSALNRPKDSRVFIGNLASEHTDAAELTSIFYPHGELIEEPVLRRSFGFVQYSTAKAARKAIAAENGRNIGGMRVDLSLADNREARKPGSKSSGTSSGRSRGRGTKRRRSASPPARKSHVRQAQFNVKRQEPLNGIYCRVLIMGQSARDFGQRCERSIASITRLTTDVAHIALTGLGEALSVASRERVPFVIVVADRNLPEETCTVRTLESSGYEKCGYGNGIIKFKDAIDIILMETGQSNPSGGASAAPGQPPPGGPGWQSGGLGQPNMSSGPYDPRRNGYGMASGPPTKIRRTDPRNGPTPGYDPSYPDQRTTFQAQPPAPYNPMGGSGGMYNRNNEPGGGLAYPGQANNGMMNRPMFGPGMPMSNQGPRPMMPGPGMQNFQGANRMLPPPGAQAGMGGYPANMGMGPTGMMPLQGPGLQGSPAMQMQGGPAYGSRTAAPNPSLPQGQGGVDIGKLNNLISAFSQMQDPQAQGQPGPQGPVPPVQAPPPNYGQNVGMPMNMGGVGNLLSNQAFMSSLQNMNNAPKPPGYPQQNYQMPPGGPMNPQMMAMMQQQRQQQPGPHQGYPGYGR
eukprot:Plantae.Rhodophyta-Hildenbrandia_rubra.ctg7744.p1 GENE.Plantae.Rhodophyta-Hildenbrandia_rubra.ctg7744~~Plantae.Rhodophyta-Hildenbrandia_rubra.ctg7744.p1  ORF type:complete len:809 (+),score=125.90 Plantae.Rhodophyta-Hildenbrandia_rubra.ctg7744:2832-5258(+)